LGSRGRGAQTDHVDSAVLPKCMAP
jgi:hypothetical protein